MTGGEAAHRCTPRRRHWERTPNDGTSGDYAGGGAESNADCPRPARFESFMTQHLVLDWSARRVVAILVQANAVAKTGRHVLAAEEVDWVDVQTLPRDERLGQRLAELVAEHRFGKATCSVLVGRDVAEVRPLSLPPVPDGELPDIVRFQAIRSFASAGDRAVVDYLVTGRQPTGVAVLVAATGGAKLQPIRQTVEAAGLKVAAITLRSTATSAWWSARSDDTAGWEVIVDIGDEVTDLIYRRGGVVQMIRTVRSGEDPIATLAGEIRRGAIACGADSETVEVVLLDRDDAQTLQSALGSSFVVDSVAAGREGQPPSHAAAVLGVVGGAGPTICFENPRRRVEPISPVRRYGPVGVAAALVALALVGYVWSGLRQLDRQIATQSDANADVAQRIAKAAPRLQRTAAVDRFLDGDVAWAKHIATLSETLPPAEELIVRSLAGSSDERVGGGQMTITGAVTSPETIAKIEQSVRQGGFEITGQGATEIESQDAYRWRVRETVFFDVNQVRRDRLTAIDEAANSGGEKSEKTQTAGQES